MRCEQGPHAVVSVAPAMHSPEPMHALHGDHSHVGLHRRDWVPQNPHGCVSLRPATHSPEPAHALHGDHSQLALHVLVCVPQLPQGWARDIPGTHVPGSTPHCRHVPMMHVPVSAQGRAPGQQVCPGIPHPAHTPP